MEKKFKEKCEEIFEKSGFYEISQKDEMRWESICGFRLTKEQKYIISNYSAIFFKDDYGVCSECASIIADEERVEPFMFFLGTKGKDTLFSVYEMYKEQLEENIYPIALADGGNLWCIDKNGKIYLWIHDEVENNACKIFDSIEQMIFSVRKVTYKKEPTGVIESQSWLADDFWSGLE